jgi:hypothetical protein
MRIVSGSGTGASIGAYAPLTAGLLRPFSGDARLQQHRRHQLDRLYQHGVDDLDQLIRAVGLKTAA